VQQLLAEVHRRLGTTPTMTRAMAKSPALLQGYLDLSGALSRGVLSPATRERIALAVAQRNNCSQCLAAHSTSQLAGSRKPTVNLGLTDRRSK
jgi:AhpD family alkylhydroperoxidase